MRGNKAWMLYSICAQEQSASQAYFKFGISQTIWHRIRTLQASSPLPFVSVSLLSAFTYKNAIAFERFMHRSLQKYRSFGEWFKFNLCDELQQRAFKNTCRELECPALGVLGKWRHFDIEGFRKNELSIQRELSKINSDWQKQRPWESKRGAYHRHSEIDIDNLDRPAAESLSVKN